MEFNSKGMFRGVCDSSGNCSVGIWEEMIPIKVNVDVGLNSDLSSGAREQVQTTAAAPTAVARVSGAAAAAIDSSSPIAQKLPTQ